MGSMTLLIRNAEILNGLGNGPQHGEVVVSGDKISAIGNFPDLRADVVLDAQGAWLTPGFIDIHSHADRYHSLWDDPAQGHSLEQGITSVVGGQDGISLAPLAPHVPDLWLPWSGRHRNASWTRMRGFLEHLRRRKLGPNFLTLVGYSNLRPFGKRASLKETLFAAERALSEGAFGISIDLEREKISAKELSAVLHLLQNGGFLALDMPRGRELPPDDLLKAIGRSRTKVVLSDPSAASDLSELVSFVEGTDNVYLEVAYTPFEVKPLREMLPERLRQAPEPELAVVLNDGWHVSRLKKEMAAADPGRLYVVQAPGHDALVGRSLAELMPDFGWQEPQTALLALLRLTGAKGLVADRSADLKELERALSSPKTLLGSGGASLLPERKPAVAHLDRNYASFVNFISAALANGADPAGIARKLCALPADILGVRDRGAILEGRYADLTCFKADGIQFTIVNGRVVFRAGEREPVFPGRVLAANSKET